MLLFLISGCFFGPTKPIAQALDCRTPRQRTVQGDMAVVTVEHPGAHCNDGSPPIMYVRAATNPEHARDWVIFLEGGGSCTEQRNCQQRWCGVGAHNAENMSSRFSPTEIQGGGLLDDKAGNPFGGYNVAQLNYCSSDQWTGTAAKPVELTGLTGGFTLYFQGHNIVDALLDELDSGARSDDGSVSLPKLSNARTIVWAGASGGGAGMMQHLDWVADRYSDASVSGLLDGWNSPNVDAFSQADREKARTALQSRWDVAFTKSWHAFTDKDCTAKNGECTAPFYLIRDAITSPLLVRHDLTDTQSGEAYVAFGVPMAAYEAAMVKSAREMAGFRPNLSIIETNCGRHIVTASPEYYTMEVQDAQNGTKAWSMAEATNAFLLEDKKVVAIDDTSGSNSTCTGAPRGGGGQQGPGGQRGKEAGGAKKGGGGDRGDRRPGR